MNREVKKRKKRFWAMCLAALLTFGSLPLEALAATAYQDCCNSDNNGECGYFQGMQFMIGDTIQLHRVDGASRSVTYKDESGGILKIYTESEISDVQTMDACGHPCLTHTVKEYSEVGGVLSTGKELKGWKVIDVARTGNASYGTTVILQAVVENATYPITYYIPTGIDPDTGESLKMEMTENDIGNNPLRYTYGTGASLTDAPSYNGGEFGGWYTSETFEDNTKVTSVSTTQTGALELYAKFTYKVTYNLAGGALCR